MYFKINCVSNAFALCAIQIHVLRTSDIASAEYLLFPRTFRKFVARRKESEREFLRSQFLRASQFLQSRFKIIKHECDAIFSAIVLAYHFTLACMLRHSYPHQVFDCGFKPKRLHEARMIRRLQRKTCRI